jgi:hypothetical protein
MPTPTTGEVIALGVLMPILDVAAVSIRIYVKRAIRRLGLDDVLILLATVFGVVPGAEPSLTEYSLCWLDVARSV